MLVDPLSPSRLSGSSYLVNEIVVILNEVYVVKNLSINIQGYEIFRFANNDSGLLYGIALFQPL